MEASDDGRAAQSADRKPIELIQDESDRRGTAEQTVGTSATDEHCFISTVGKTQLDC